MIARLTPAFALAGTMFLTGCAVSPGSYMVYGERYHPGYDFGELQYYNGDKEMAVAVLLSPFETPNSEQDIALAMRGKNRGARIAFTVEPGPLTPSQTQIIIAFDQKPTDDGYAYCSGKLPDAVQKPESGLLRMVMVYCKRSAFVSSVRARMPRPAGIEDPAFRNMLAEVTRRLLPRPHPLHDDDRLEEIRRLRSILFN